MDKVLKDMVEEVVEKDTYTHEEYEAVKKRLEEISYADSWADATIKGKIVRIVKGLEEERDETAFSKFFKGFIGILIELIF